jgi:SH3-like domain-containing protein
MVYNGERLEILEKGKRFVKVRSPRGEIGWMEQRYLISAEVYDEFTKLAAENKNATAQAHAVTRATLNMHVTPGRDTEHLFQLKEADKVEILRRATAEKPQVPGAVLTRGAKLAAKKDGKAEKPAGPPLEDWLLVRDGQGHTGWVLSRMLDVDAPMEIAQYAEGQRIVACFVLNQVQDEDKKVAQYITLTTEPRDGLPWDFDQARIFTWNLKRHRYETAYRERHLNGVFPVKVGSEDFGKEGTLPVFVLRVKDDAGNVFEKKYRLIGPIVRRVMTPQEEQREKEARAQRLAERAARRP